MAARTKPDPTALTKADSRALWRAVDEYRGLLRAMRTMDFTPEQIASEQQALANASRALRKVQALVRKG